MELATPLMRTLEQFKIKFKERETLENEDYKADRNNSKVLYLSKLRL